MEHSVKEIGKRYSKISRKRKDKKLFDFDKFMKFAKDNMKKYQLLKSEYIDGDFTITTFHTNDLINDFKNTL